MLWQCNLPTACPWIKNTWLYCSLRSAWDIISCFFISSTSFDRNAFELITWHSRTLGRWCWLASLCYLPLTSLLFSHLVFLRKLRGCFFLHSQNLIGLFFTVDMLPFNQICSNYFYFLQLSYSTIYFPMQWLCIIHLCSVFSMQSHCRMQCRHFSPVSLWSCLLKQCSISIKRPSSGQMHEIVRPLSRMLCWNWTEVFNKNFPFRWPYT